MNDARPVLVTGASGNTGRPLAEQLHAAGAAVRGMVRSTRSAATLPEGVTPALADFDDVDGLRAALDGVRAAYLVTPSSERVEEQQLRFVDLAADAGLEHLVVLSQLAAQEDSPVRFLRYHAVVERRVRERGLGFTFLRPNLFFQGLLQVAPLVASQGVLPAPIGEARISAVDVRDIAEVAAASLTDARHLGQTYTLTGPAAITHGEVAAALAEATGHPVTFVDTPPEQFADALRGAMPEWQLGGLLEDYAHYRAGEAAEVTSVIPEVTGHPARGLDDFVRDYASAFAPAR